MHLEKINSQVQMCCNIIFDLLVSFNLKHVSVFL